MPRLAEKDNKSPMEASGQNPLTQRETIHENTR